MRLFGCRRHRRRLCLGRTHREGCGPERGYGRGRHHHRAEWRRQVDRAETNLRTAVPVAGRVLIGGEDITGQSPQAIAKAGLGFVPQERNVFGSLTIAENLEVSCLFERSAAKKRMEEAYARFPMLFEKRRISAQSLVRRTTSDPRHSDGSHGQAPRTSARRAYGRSQPEGSARALQHTSEVSPTKA